MYFVSYLIKFMMSSSSFLGASFQFLCIVSCHLKAVTVLLLLFQLEFFNFFSDCQD